MQVTNTHDLGLGWTARLYENGSMCFSYDLTGYHLTIPKESVDTLTDIVAQIRNERAERDLREWAKEN